MRLILICSLLLMTSYAVWDSIPAGAEQSIAAHPLQCEAAGNINTAADQPVIPSYANMAKNIQLSNHAEPLPPDLMPEAKFSERPPTYLSWTQIPSEFAGNWKVDFITYKTHRHYNSLAARRFYYPSPGAALGYAMSGVAHCTANNRAECTGTFHPDRVG